MEFARIGVVMVAVAAATLLPAPPVLSQEAIVKAEELIRMQWIPYSRLATFDQQYPEGIFPATDAMELVFALLAGAPPGSGVYTRLDQVVPAADREEVTRFLNSSAFSKERQARLNWSEAIVKNKSAVPLLIGSVIGMVELLSDWKKTRMMPTALPLSISQIDPGTLHIPVEYPLLKLEDDGTPAALSCMPKLSDTSIKNLTLDRDGKSYRDFTSLIRMTDAKNIVATRREFAACIPTTTPGYPIPAINSFLDTIRIGGMDDAESRRWYQGIAQEIGANGASESLVIMENGSAYEISYAVNLRSPHMLVYLSRYFPVGTYDQSRYRTVMKSANYKVFSTMSTSGADCAQRREKSLITTPEDVRRFEERTKRTTATPDRSADNPGRSKLGVITIAGEGLNSNQWGPRHMAKLPARPS